MSLHIRNEVKISFHLLFCFKWHFQKLMSDHNIWVSWCLTFQSLYLNISMLAIMATWQMVSVALLLPVYYFLRSLWKPAILFLSCLIYSKFEVSNPEFCFLLICNLIGFVSCQSISRGVNERESEWERERERVGGRERFEKLEPFEWKLHVMERVRCLARFWDCRLSAIFSNLMMTNMKDNVFFGATSLSVSPEDVISVCHVT